MNNNRNFEEANKKSYKIWNKTKLYKTMTMEPKCQEYKLELLVKEVGLAILVKKKINQRFF